MSPKYSTAERALEEAVRVVKEAYDTDHVVRDGAKVEFEGAVPWEGILELMADIQVDDPEEPDDGETEMWAVMFSEVGSIGFVHATIVFGSDGKVCAAGVHAD